MKFIPNINKKTSLSTDYLVIVGFIVLALVIVIFLYSFLSYRSYLREENQNMIISSIKIKRTVEKSFNYINHLVLDFAKNIRELPDKDPQLIAVSLKTEFNNNPIVRDVFSWTLFEWVDDQNHLTPMNSFEKPYDVTNIVNYSTVVDARANPEIIHFGAPRLGKIKQEWIVPASYGIVDENSKYIGAISMGFSIKSLKGKIEQEISNHKYSYMLVNENMELILASSDNNIDGKLDNYNNFRKKIKLANGRNDYLVEPVKYNDILYNYYRKIDDAPFIILMGYNIHTYKQELLDVIIASSSDVTIMGSIFILILLLLRRMLVLPIQKLSIAAEKIIITEGKGDVNIPNTNIKELSILGLHLNKLIHFIQKLKATEAELRVSKNAIEVMHQEIKQINSKLEHKILERTHELEKALSSKTEFLNNISHEVRTPIQGFTSISEGLVKHWQKFDEQKRYELAKQVYNNAQRLYSLVGNLLDLSKFSAGKMLLDLKKNDLVKITKTIIEESKLLYLNEKHIDFIFTAPKESLIISDVERMTQVIRNLFVNAIKFSSENSRIYINILESEIIYDNNNKGEAIHFSISDEGIGIPEDELKSIFTPFVQSSRTKTKAGGTGLGLAICNEIILAHNGRIWAENNPKGGAIFNFIVPTTQSKQLAGHNIIAENFIEQIIEKEKPADKSTVLIVDDEEVCLTSMELLLHGGNYNLIKAPGGEPALEILKSRKVDVVFLDLMMPDMYGLNVLQEIKKNPTLSLIPVILQTGSSDETEIRKAFDMGIFSYVKKPYQRKIIIAELNRALSS